MPFPPSKKKRRRSRLGKATLTLTSMMDMFTIILLFLLASYSAEGDMLAVGPDFKLPVSTATEASKINLLIQITSDDIIVDGVSVAENKDALKGEDLLIKPLFEALNKNTMKMGFIAKDNPSLRFTGELVIQGHRDISFLLLERVMYTCGQAGYNNISLAVISSET